LLAGEDRERDRHMCLAGARVAEEDHGLAVIDPRSLRERGDGGLRDLRVVLEAVVLQSFHQREPRVDQTPSLSPLSSFGDLRLQ
jgi:hypothetical protein